MSVQCGRSDLLVYIWLPLPVLISTGGSCGFSKLNADVMQHSYLIACQHREELEESSMMRRTGEWDCPRCTCSSGAGAGRTGGLPSTAPGGGEAVGAASRRGWGCSSSGGPRGRRMQRPGRHRRRSRCCRGGRQPGGGHLAAPGRGQRRRRGCRRWPGRNSVWDGGGTAAQEPAGRP